jgi:hypothetical protein
MSTSYKAIYINKPAPDEDDDHVDVDEYYDILDDLLEPEDESQDYLSIELDGETVLIPFSLLLSIAQIAQCAIMPEPNETVH